jgi:hypothetical protein
MVGWLSADTHPPSREGLRVAPSNTPQTLPGGRVSAPTKSLPGPFIPQNFRLRRAKGGFEIDRFYTCTSLVGEEPSHLWPAFPRDPLGFSQIPGHCATQCRVVVTADMVALTQNKIWVSLTSRRPHTSSTRTIRDQKSQRKRSPSTAARSRAQVASGCRRARSTAVHGGAEPAVAALVGASGVKMMRWSAMLNGGVASP